MISSGINAVAIASAHSEKTCLKKLMKMMMMMMMIIEMREKIFFSGRQKLTSAMKLRPEK